MCDINCSLNETLQWEWRRRPALCLSVEVMEALWMLLLLLCVRACVPSYYYCCDVNQMAIMFTLKSHSSLSEPDLKALHLLLLKTISCLVKLLRCFIRVRWLNVELDHLKCLWPFSSKFRAERLVPKHATTKWDSHIHTQLTAPVTHVHWALRTPSALLSALSLAQTQHHGWKCAVLIGHRCMAKSAP